MNTKTRIGLLATGNELTEGDIANSNGQMIARQLADHGLEIGFHVTASDNETDIIDSLQFLVNHHDVIITIGGLGPTSDDRTRYGISHVINKPLVFDNASWENILNRYKRLNISIQPHPTNQQQALFPAGATVIPNPNGTAAGCKVNCNNKIIFMLPGPPSECLPMFKENVLPELLINQTTLIKKLKWRLLGAIESEVAASVEEIMKKYSVTTGYRIDYPYLEVKIYPNDATCIDEITIAINRLFNNHVLGHPEKSAVELLTQAIIAQTHMLVINDHATHGKLQSQLITPQTYPKILFGTTNNPDYIYIEINGLTAYWEGQSPTGKIDINLTFHHKNNIDNKTLTIPFRNQYIMKFAIEYIARAILDYLT